MRKGALFSFLEQGACLYMLRMLNLNVGGVSWGLCHSTMLRTYETPSRRSTYFEEWSWQGKCETCLVHHVLKRGVLSVLDMFNMLDVWEGLWGSALQDESVSSCQV